MLHPHPFQASLRTLTAGLVLGLAIATSACSKTSSAQTPDTAEVQREVRDLMRALKAVPTTSLPVERSAWNLTRKSTVERARTLSVDFGREARRVLTEERPEQEEVRAGLLEAAAYCDPAGTTEILVGLVLQWDDELLVRRKAAELLGVAAPDRAIEVMEPILRDKYDGRTYPPEEAMLLGYLTACRKNGHDATPLLARVATDIQRAQDVRHYAARQLGEFDSPLSRQALQNLMTESSGNSYIRRIAVQSLQKLMPKEELCTLVQEIQRHEADESMILFLESVINTNCR